MLRIALTTVTGERASYAGMSVTSIHRSKQPRRPHYIEAWAEVRGLSQADIARELGADKSVISRWFSGSTPSVEYQERLAALFECEPESLFRHPNDDWLARFFANRTKEEVERMKMMLEAAFPSNGRTGTSG